MRKESQKESRLGLRDGELISAHRGSQALGPTLHVPSHGSLTSPLPLGSVRTEIASEEADVCASFRLRAECSSEMTSANECKDVLHLGFVGGEDLKRIGTG